MDKLEKFFTIAQAEMTAAGFTAFGCDSIPTIRAYRKGDDQKAVAVSAHGYEGVPDIVEFAKARAKHAIQAYEELDGQRAEA